MAEGFLVYSIIDYQFNFSYRRLGVRKKSLKLNAFKLYDLFGSAHSPNVFLDVHEIYNSNGDLDLHNYEFRFPYICVRVEKKILKTGQILTILPCPEGLLLLNYKFTKHWPCCFKKKFKCLIVSTRRTTTDENELKKVT